jgi:hypothetical protein
MDFLPARNKLEAVVRISNLTNSGPEILGPGSKEKKSVFENLARGLEIAFDATETKQSLAKLIAHKLGASWDSSCESIGQTVTLIGLNRLLEAAETTGRIDSKRIIDISTYTFSEEVLDISKIAVKETPLVMDGKECVQEMKEAEDPRWRHVQWQGFYFEMKMQSSLTQQLGGGRKKLVNTEFDYVLKNIWDMKAHSTVSSSGKTADQNAILNDSRAMELAINNGGLGLILLNGIPTYDMEFTKWHKQFRGDGVGEPGRTLKSKFVASELEMYFIPTTERLDEAIHKKQLSLKPQGKNSNGKPRPDKYHINLNLAKESDLLVFSHNFN